MRGKREFYKEGEIGPLTFVHSASERSTANEGKVEYEVTTEYLYHAKSRQVIERRYSSCINVIDAKQDWSHRLDSEKVVDTERIPEEVRKKIQELGLGK